MAKCPWCNSEIDAEFDDAKQGFIHFCLNNCYVSLNVFKTKKKALAAASKRFMPKRTVEEIISFIREARDNEQKNAYALVEKDNRCDKSAWRIATAKFATRLSDFITGSNE